MQGQLVKECIFADVQAREQASGMWYIVGNKGRGTTFLRNHGVCLSNCMLSRLRRFSPQ